MNRTLKTLVSAAGIAALAACSSGDDNSDKISGLEADLAKARADLATANAAASDLRDDLASANNDLNKANSDLATANEAASDLRDDLASANSNLNKANSDLADANEALGSTNTELSDLRMESEAAEVARHYYGLGGDRYISGRYFRAQRADDGSTLTITFSGALEHRDDIVLDRIEEAPPPISGAQGEWFDGPSTPRTGISAVNDAILYRTPLGADSYLQYGWWVAEGGNSAGRSWIESYGLLISTTGDITRINDISEIPGQATFAGDAAGIYAISNPAQGHNESGAFTADATLTVDFDDSSASGTIDNFVVEGQGKGWSVSLLSQDFLADRRAFTSAPQNGRAETQWTLSASQNTPGTSGLNWWYAALHRDGADSDMMGAIGVFNAHYTNIGRMTGAFGAKKQ